MILHCDECGEDGTGYWDYPIGWTINGYDPHAIDEDNPPWPNPREPGDEEWLCPECIQKIKNKK